MALSTPDIDLPHGVEVARFARRTKRLGFMGGQTETIEYDLKLRNDEQVEYRSYVERHSPAPPAEADEGDFELDEVTPTTQVARVHSNRDLQYTLNEGKEDLYLVTWDNGANIHIMDADEMAKVVNAALSQEDRLRPEDIPSDAEGLFSDSSSFAEPPTETSQSDTSEGDSGDEEQEVGAAPSL